MAGLTSAGFESKTLETILADIVARQRAALGPAIVTSSDSALGVINGILADQLAELWELAEAVYNSAFPDGASGASLDRVCALTGVLRLQATNSTVTITLTGDDGTVIPAGSVVSVDPSGDRFVLLEDATIASGTVDALFAAETAGPVIANSGTLTVIETPISGWTAATNAEDADVGRALETDEELRQRRADLLEVAGNATLEAIRADVLDVTDVTQARVFENTSEVTVDGIPPHAVEVVALGGEDADVAAAIFASVAAGIDTHGSVTETVTDSQDIDHTIKFSRPTDKPLMAQVSIRLVEGADSASVQAALKASLAAAFLDAQIGGDDGKVYVSRLYRYAFVSGVLDVDVLEIAPWAAFSPTYTTDSLTIAARELASLDTSDIAVTVL